MLAPPRFSVVIPLHNKAPHVADAIESALAQTPSPHEIIVIDDASSDGGDHIVATHYGDRVRLLRRSEAGPGGYAARNLGISVASGEWIAFLDADDIWLPNHLSVLADLIAHFPAAGMAATRYWHSFASGRSADHVAPFLRDGEHLLNLQSFLSAWLKAGHCPAWTSAIAIRRALLQGDNNFPAGRAKRGGDKDLWLRIAAQAPIAFSSTPTAEFRREAVNKVTDRTDTRALPCLVPTARAMKGDASPAVARLLRRLINQEIALYARWSAKAGQRPLVGFRDLDPPAGIGVIITLIGVFILPNALLRLPSHMARWWRMVRNRPVTADQG